MPLPLIPIVGGVLAAGGLAAMVKSHKDSSKAGDLNTEASNIIVMHPVCQGRHYVEAVKK